MGKAGLPGVPCSLLQVAHENRDFSDSAPTNKAAIQMPLTVIRVVHN
jgi:hypothetical protein